MTASDAAPTRSERMETAEKAFTSGLGKLALALAKAQAQAERVVKDKVNSHHGYSYASADALIGSAKEALRGCGLALIPTRRSLEYGGVTNPETGEELPAGRLTLRRDYMLVHESGESLPITDRWPVIPDKGRPVDKALAMAATTSLGYLLRDLLLMPRGDTSEDMDSDENETEAPVNLPVAPAAQAPVQQQVEPTTTQSDPTFKPVPVTSEVVANEIRTWGLDPEYDIEVASQKLTPWFKRHLSEAAKAALGDSGFDRVGKAWETAGAPLKTQPTAEQTDAFVRAIMALKPPATPEQQMAADLAESFDQGADLIVLNDLPETVAAAVRALPSNESEVPGVVLRELFSYLSSEGVLGSGAAARAAFLAVGIDKLPAPADNPVRRKHVLDIARSLSGSTEPATTTSGEA